MPCTFCHGEHDTTACPRTTWSSGNCLVCGGDHGNLPCPNSVPGDDQPGHMGGNHWLQPPSWTPHVFPADYNVKLDRIIELLEALVANQPIETETRDAGGVDSTVPKKWFEDRDWTPPEESHFFECPMCGSHHFGTHFHGDVSDWEKAEGLCHGPNCQFKWNRKDDAILGFHGI